MQAAQGREGTNTMTAVEALGSIVGKEHVRTGSDAVAGFLRRGDSAPGLIAVCPGSTEDVQAIVKLANEKGLSLVTSNDRYLLPEDLGREGVLLDFSRMNKIERIDDRNLVAHIERGVTWAQLTAELTKKGVKTIAPVAANSESVAESIVARAQGRNLAKYPDYAWTNMKVVLGDGTVMKTGNHGLSEEASDGRNEGGPNLSQWYVGSDDIFGVMTRASVMLWPLYEGRTCCVFGFDDLEELLKAMKEVPRTDLGCEYFAISKVSMASVLEKEGDYPAWSLVVGFEGRRRLVAHNEDRVRGLLSKYNCQANEDLKTILTPKLNEHWMEASDNHTAFFSRFSTMKALDDAVNQAASGAGVADVDVGRILVSYDRGRAIYAVYDWFCDEDKCQELDKLNLSICHEGAFFDRPHGEVARKIYTNIPNHLPVLKHIKSFLDPNNVMNAGRTILPEDEQWRPPAVAEGAVGITVANLKEVKAELVEAVGEDWVSDNPIDLSSYGRDFTIFSGERPNLVVLPYTLEDVQKVMRIAYARGIPIVPQTTGFNHGGLTVPRKGGLLVDLRRMDQTMNIDEETMTLQVSPAVRMRSCWWECSKRTAIPGYSLKPILPLTFGSVSLLSNYVARGAPASVYKYGSGPELTVNMTWVLPNGEVLRVGPSAVKGAGNLPLHWGAGPEISGMFFNADGQFGICTELTAKIYPEPDDTADSEKIVIASITELDPHKAFDLIVDAFYDLGRENITEFQYKAHPGTFALAITAKVEGTKVMDMIGMAPRHPVGVIVIGFDKEEKEIKEEILAEIFDKYSMFIIDTSMFGDEMATMATPELTKKSLGILDNFVGTYKGAFQWTAGQVKMDLLPAMNREYELLVEKYWKTSNPKVDIPASMTDLAVQGPSPMGRSGPCEFDFWWDQGNPEEVKRATQMLHKTNKMILRYGGALWRNMFGAGEYHLPLWGPYFDVLKRTKKAFDPANLMHPDVLPLTDDYI